MRFPRVKRLIKSQISKENIYYNNDLLCESYIFTYFYVLLKFIFIYKIRYMYYIKYVYSICISIKKINIKIKIHLYG